MEQGGLHTDAIVGGRGGPCPGPIVELSHRSRVELLDCRDSCTVRRSPWTALRPGVVQHGEFHSAEQAGGETVSMAITTALSHRSARRVSLRILQRLKTKNIRITVKLLGMCTPRLAGRTTERAARGKFRCIFTYRS